MADPQYRTFNLVSTSRGITSRYVDDAAPGSTFLNLENCEELAEESIASRLGSTILNQTGTTPNPLSGLVHSITKLSGLGGNAWRYAGSGTNLYRAAVAGMPGPYTQIAANLSGQPWQAKVYRPSLTANPTIFVADAARMLKDNGTFNPPQQMGIFQPQQPVSAQAQAPDEIVLDAFRTSTYTTSGIGSFSDNYVIGTTNTTSAVTATGIQSVSVDPAAVGLFRSFVIDTGANAETVLILLVTATGFIADFTKTHASGVTIQEYGLSGSVPPSGTGVLSNSFAGTPISAWPTILNQEDYIAMALYISDPTTIQSITLKFDCGDGSFSSDYFYKVIAQGPLQALINSSTNNANDPTTAATDAVLDSSLNLFGNSAGSIAELNTGDGATTQLLIQLSDFSASGRADFNDPIFNWSNVNGYQITIQTTTVSTGLGLFELSSLLLFGGAGPDSFAGVAYDWLFTFYNNVDGTESNPCMVMTNINPPSETSWVTPRRQPVLLTLTYPFALDSQTTSIRIYRRGGTLGDNYRRVDEVLIAASPQRYLDVSSDVDIQQADFISFTNDVPVTSTLPVPVNTTLTAIAGGPNAIATITPASMANISIAQQVTIGSLTAPSVGSDTETVIVLSVGATTFTAYVQNTHTVGEPISATAQYGQPVTIMEQAYGQMWFAGDPNNPHYLYFSAASNPQAVSSAAYVEVGTPDDPITVIVQFKGNLYVSTRKFWWSVAPGSNATASPTVYPTACKHGCVAPLGWIATEEAIYYQAMDGIRAFAGGASAYLTQDLEFIFQGVGTSPIVEANQALLSQTRMAFWNMMIFVSYVGVDGNRHRLIFHAGYKRWRNDDIDAQSIFLEADTNTLVFGDSLGYVHQDRIGYTDDAVVGGAVVQSAIAMTMQWPYMNQATPAVQKNYNELTLDVNTGGQTLNVELLFNDGETSLAMPSISTTERERINLNLNNGDGFEAYKVSLLLTCAAAARVYIYQVAIRALELARTRQSMDSFWLRFGSDESKLVKQVYIEFSSAAPVVFFVYYDGLSTAGFTFTLPASEVRNSQRVRLPAVKCRLIRFVATSTEDFQFWTDSRCEYKMIASGKGYSVQEFGMDG